jgi:hypothetical protein
LIHVARGYGSGEGSNRNPDWLTRINARCEVSQFEEWMLKNEVGKPLFRYDYRAGR